MIKLSHKGGVFGLRYAIIYASTAGGTEQSAKIIKDKLNFEYQIQENDIDLIDLTKRQSVDPKQFGRCIIGTGIYAGKAHKAVKTFIHKNIEALLTMPVSLFICSLAGEKENQKYKHVFPEKLLAHAAPVSFFGGMVIFKRLNIFARIMMRMITHSKKDIHQLKHQVIHQFVQEIVER